MDTILDEYTQLMKMNGQTLLERRIRVLIKPSPKFIPERIWLKLATKFLYMTESYK